MATNIGQLLQQGLLTGVGSTQQPVQQAVPGSPNFYGEFMAARGRGLQQGLGRLARGGEPSTQERIQGAMFELSSPTTDGTAKDTATRIADLTKLARVQQVQGNTAAAAQTAAQVQQLREEDRLQKTTESLKAERSSLADFLELEYGVKGGSLRPAVMSGAINAGNIDKFIKKEEKDKITFKNITYTDAEGKTQTQMVGFNEQGKSFSETGQPIILPDDAQITITGRTEQDVDSGISEFTSKEFKAVRDDIISSRGKLKVLEGVTEESIDKYLSLLGKATAATGRGLSSLTGLGGDAINELVKEGIGVDLQEFAGEQGLLFGDLENYFNQKRHDITGAAAAISELKELRKGILSGETSPAVAKAKIAQIIQRERDSQEMNFTLLKQNGLDIKSYFDENATATPTYKEDVSNLTVSQQENKAVVDRILEAIKSERRD
jgi:hypothetical protein